MATTPAQLNPNETLPQGWGGSTGYIPGAGEGFGGSSQVIQPTQENQLIPPPQFMDNFRPGVANPGIISTTNYRDGLNQGEVAINEFQNDPYQQLFQRLEEQNRIAEENAILTATAEGKRQNVQQEQAFNRQRSALESANIAGGLSRYAPEMASGLIEQAYNENLQDVRNIQLEEISIAKAKEARADNDLDLMREQLDYARALRKEKADALMEAQKFAFEKEKFAKNLALDWAQENRLGSDGGSGGKNFTAVNIPDDVQANLIDDIAAGENLKALSVKYPNVATTYISSLISALNGTGGSMVDRINALFGEENGEIEI